MNLGSKDTKTLSLLQQALATMAIFDAVAPLHQKLNTDCPGMDSRLGWFDNLLTSHRTTVASQHSNKRAPIRFNTYGQNYAITGVYSSHDKMTDGSTWALLKW